jgi:glycosyltransferase involved in cell wall biosynthesis
MRPAMKLSVFMLAYNQERFIAQAIDSILMQDVDFDYEIVIGEDCSTDSTRDVIRDYAQRWPNRIKPLFRPRNVGIIQNAIDAYSACTGEYVAMLEGDDFWTDRQKLRLQVTALDEHPDWAICFHPTKVLNEVTGEETMELPSVPDRKPVYELVDILLSNFIPTASTVFRNRIFAEFPVWTHGLPMLDWPIHVLNARTGKIGMIDRVMSVYRVHGGGVWSTQNKARQLEQTRKMFELFATHVAPEHAGLLKTESGKIAGWLTQLYLDQGNRPAARRALLDCVMNGGLRQRGFRRRIPRLALQCFLSSSPTALEQRKSA